MGKRTFSIVTGLGLVILAGCVPTIPSPPSWLEIHSSDGAVVTGQIVPVESGQSLTFYVEGSADLVLELTTWRMEEGQYRGEFFGHSYTNTFVNTSGESITYKIRVIGRDSVDVEQSFWVEVASGPTASDKPVFVDGVTFWSGGVLNPDGSVSVGPGGRLDFDLTRILRGGVPPYRYYLDSGSGFVEQSGPSFFWWAPNVTVTTTFRLIIRVVDANGNSVERWLVVIVVVNPLPPPPPPPVTVDLKVNGSDGIVNVKARASDNQQNVDLWWRIAGAAEGAAFGAWSGNKTTSGTVTVTLAVGTHVFGLSVVNSEGQSGIDSVTVVVTPADQPPNPAPLVVSITAPAQDSVVQKGVSTTFTVLVSGGTPPYAVNWLFFDGSVPSTTSVSTTISIVIEFLRTTPGQFPVDQYVQVVDSKGRVSSMAVVRIRVVQ